MSSERQFNLYFQNKTIREYLIKAGLINRHGDILPAASRSVPSNRSPQRKSKRTQQQRSKSLVATNSARQESHGSVQDSKETVTEPISHEEQKSSRFRRTRPIPLYQPEKSRSVDLLGGDKSGKSRRAKSANNLAANSRKPAPFRPVTAQTVPNDRCRIIMIYHGPPKRSRRHQRRIQPRADEIMVMQQHCGGENLIVFKDFVFPNQKFAFDSRRHHDFPFGLALYINGLIDSRISVCCEYRHRTQLRLGSKSGSFAICEIRPIKSTAHKGNDKITKKSFAKRGLNSNPDRYRESVIAPFPPTTDRSTSPSHDQTSTSSLLQTLVRITSPPLVRTPTPPLARTLTPPVKRESPRVVVDPKPNLLSMDYETTSNETITSKKQPEKDQYASDFDQTESEEEIEYTQPKKQSPLPPVATNDQGSSNSTPKRITKNRKGSASSYKSSASASRVSMPVSSTSHPERMTDQHLPQLSHRRPSSTSSFASLKKSHAPEEPTSTAPTTTDNHEEKKSPAKPSMTRPESPDWFQQAVGPKKQPQPTTQRSFVRRASPKDDFASFFDLDSKPTRSEVNDESDDEFFNDTKTTTTKQRSNENSDNLFKSASQNRSRKLFDSD